MSFATSPELRRASHLRQQARKRAAEHSVYGIMPVLATLALIVYSFKLQAVAADYHDAYYPAATRLLDGFSPYAMKPGQIAAGTGFVYPALAALMFAPLALLGSGPSQVIDMFVGIAAVPAILWTLNVRDWRVYGVVMLWLPIFDGWQSGNVTLPLTLMVALAWRHRDRPWVAGLLTATAISVKPFVWPVGLWLLATRRWKAAAWALASGLVLNLLAWELVGFNEISTFVHLSSEDTRALWKGGYSTLAVAHHLGWSRSTGETLLLLSSVAAAAILVYLGAVKRRERDAFVLAVLLMLLASPLLWAHYFSLLLIPLALCRPQLGVAWVLPIMMWPMPPRQPVHGWEEALGWVLTALVLGVCLRTPPQATTTRTAPLPAAA
jgi:alpha-1,2-mannosyltransferase